MRLRIRASNLYDILYPRRCPVCDRPVRPAGKLICEECEGIPERIEGATCRKCGKMLPDGTAVYCSDCAGISHVYRQGTAVFTYRSISGAVFRFKYSGRREYAEYFAREMAEVLMYRIKNDFRVRPDMLVPVPLHSARMRVRGYNQSALMAAGISALTGIPIREDVLSRTENTVPMKNMSVSDRQNNLKNAFHACSFDVKLKTIIVIDDIYTTGATIDACATELYRAGAAFVFFMTLAIGTQADVEKNA
ncbi:MAG: ComF family protein [Lachnospiraceae bacterium]|nr:ComF family protein [Lachnospiraceae bacterium]MDD4524643.1 ComF family protein [Lachnospiraceae bacterium]